jgi:hypothetical protein
MDKIVAAGSINDSARPTLCHIYRGHQLMQILGTAKNVPIAEQPRAFSKRHWSLFANDNRIAYKFLPQKHISAR